MDFQLGVSDAIDDASDIEFRHDIGVCIYDWVLNFSINMFLILADADYHFDDSSFLMWSHWKSKHSIISHAHDSHTERENSISITK